MRKLGIALAVVVVLVIVAVLALPRILDVNSYRDSIQSELRARTGRYVSLGAMRLKLVPFALSVDNAIIGEDPRFRSNAPFAQASELLVSLKLVPLLQKRVEISSLELRNPRIELVRDAQGVWNFSSLGKQPAPSQPRPAARATPTPAQPAAPQPESQPAPRQFTLARLLIDDGQVAVTDDQKRQPRAVYDHIDLDLRDYAPGKPVKIDLAAHLPGGGKQELRLTGEGGPVQDDLLATNFAGQLKLDGVSLAGLKKFVNSAALADMEFVATGSTDLNNQAGVLAARGNITLQNLRVRGVDIGYPIAADFDISDDFNRDFLTIHRGALKLGSTPLDLKGTVNMGPTPAQLDVRARANNASIADAAKLAGAFGVAFNPGMQVDGNVDADLAVRGASSSPQMNGTVAARALVISGRQLPQPVHVTQVNLALTPSQVRSNEFVASTGSTSVRVAFTLDDYSTPRSAIDATLRAPNSQLGELISIGQAWGVRALDGMAGAGPVSLDVRVAGPLKDPAALNYSGSGSLQNASLTLPSFTRPLLVQNANLRFSQNAMNLENAAFSLGSTHATGQVSIRGLAPNATPQAQFALNADKFSVAEWQGLMRNPAVEKTTAALRLVPPAYADPKPEPPLLQRLTGGGTLNVGTVVYDQLLLTNLKATAALDRGVVRLDPVTANVAGGVESGTIVIDARPTPAAYAVNAKLSNVDANQLLSSISNLKQVLYGVLAANADTRFMGSTNGGSAGVARTLNGRLSLDLMNGKLAGIDLLNQLALIGKFLNVTRASGPFTNIARLSGDFVINNGVAHTDNLTAAIDGGTLGAKGDVDLANKTVQMAATAVLSPEFAKQAGGNNIGGYLTTALANSKGELVMPVLIRGNLASPQVLPDYNAIAQMKLNNIMPSGANPASITGILGAITGKRQTGTLPQADQQQQQQPGQTQQQKPPNPMQSILDALGGKKPGQQQQQQTPPK